jgi:hypothetical protein
VGSFEEKGGRTAEPEPNMVENLKENKTIIEKKL